MVNTNTDTNTDIVLRNSGVHPDKLEESTLFSDIASLPQMLQKIITEKYNTSLLWQICDLLPLNSTIGKVYASKKKFQENKFEIVNKDVNIETYKMSSGFTQEVIEDVKRLYSQNASDLIASTLRGVSDYNENTHLMDFLDANSEEKPELVLTADPRDDVLLITQKIGGYIMEMNKDTYKTKEAWAILPRKYIGTFAGYWSGFRMDDIEDDKYLYIGKFGMIHLYINPRDEINTLGEFNDDYNDDYDIDNILDIDHIYVGIKNEKRPGYGSLIFSPYNYHLEYAIDPDTGENVVHVFNRYALNTGVFHKPLERNGMLYKFKISRII